jgi:hypothetical protein
MATAKFVYETLRIISMESGVKVGHDFGPYQFQTNKNVT